MVLCFVCSKWIEKMIEERAARRTTPDLLLLLVLRLVYVFVFFFFLNEKWKLVFFSRVPRFYEKILYTMRCLRYLWFLLVAYGRIDEILLFFFYLFASANFSFAHYENSLANVVQTHIFSLIAIWYDVEFRQWNSFNVEHKTNLPLIKQLIRLIKKWKPNTLLLKQLVLDHTFQTLWQDANRKNLRRSGSPMFIFSLSHANEKSL